MRLSPGPLIALPLCLALGLSSGGCEQREGSTRVVIETEPLGEGAFDRLVIEVRAAGAAAPCAACRRELSPNELLTRGRSSFTIVSPDAAPTLQITLSRARVAAVRPEASIVVTGTFAAPDVETVTVHLPFADTGRPRGSWDAPVVFGAIPEPSLALPPTLGQPCTTPDDPAQACVPGAVFWLGDPALDLFGGVDREGKEERLVVLSPFWIDRAEITVGALRAAGTYDDIVPFRHELDRACTFTREPGDNEALPVGCITWPFADAFCRARGARLPTEAELEHVMGGRRSRRFVWGDAPIECGDASTGEDDCGLLGPAAAGAFARDTLLVGDRPVVDLVGNLAEWAADRWNGTAADEACFAPHVLRDPRCDLDSVKKPGHRVVKGTGWGLPLLYAGAAFRFGLDGERAYNASVGFRCARDGIER